MTGKATTPSTLAALRQATPGSEIRLAPGEYSAARLKGLPGKLTFTADDPASPPRFTRGLTLDQPTGLTLRGVDIDISSASASFAAGLTVYGGDGLTIEGGRIVGLEKPDGVRWGRGIVASDVSNFTVKGTLLEHLFRGIVISSANGVLLDGLDLFDLGSDGINLGQVAGVTIRRCQIVGFAPVGDDHPDGIQVMTGAAGGPSSNITIEDVLIACGATKRAQGIFTKAENREVRHANIAIRRVLLVNVGWHGIAGEAIDGVEVDDATLLFQVSPENAGTKSWIKLAGSTGRVANSRAMAFDDPKTPGLTSENLTVIPAATEAEIQMAMAAWRAKFRPAPVEKPAEAEVIEITVKAGQTIVIRAA